MSVNAKQHIWCHSDNSNKKNGFQCERWQLWHVGLFEPWQHQHEFNAAKIKDHKMELHSGNHSAHLNTLLDACTYLYIFSLLRRMAKQILFLRSSALRHQLRALYAQVCKFAYIFFLLLWFSSNCEWFYLFSHSEAPTAIQLTEVETRNKHSYPLTVLVVHEYVCPVFESVSACVCGCNFLR